jgi:hypothetical protein
VLSVVGGVAGVLLAWWSLNLFLSVVSCATVVKTWCESLSISHRTGASSLFFWACVIERSRVWPRSSVARHSLLI